MANTTNPVRVGAYQTSTYLMDGDMGGGLGCGLGITKKALSQTEWRQLYEIGRASQRPWPSLMLPRRR